MEGVALSLLDCKKYLEEKGVEIGKKAYIIGGGAKSKVWRQIVADALAHLPSIAPGEAAGRAYIPLHARNDGFLHDLQAVCHAFIYFFIGAAALFHLVTDDQLTLGNRHNRNRYFLLR